MRSDLIKEGPSRAPHRSLLRALGIDELEMKRPFVAVVNSKSDYIPGHMHLDKIAEQVKAGIRNAGGVPFEFNTIGVCADIFKLLGQSDWVCCSSAFAREHRTAVDENARQIQTACGKEHTRNDFITVWNKHDCIKRMSGKHNLDAVCDKLTRAK